MDGVARQVLADGTRCPVLGHHEGHALQRRRASRQYGPGCRVLKMLSHVHWHLRTAHRCGQKELPSACANRICHVNQNARTRTHTINQTHNWIFRDKGVQRPPAEP